MDRVVLVACIVVHLLFFLGIAKGSERLVLQESG